MLLNRGIFKQMLVLLITLLFIGGCGHKLEDYRTEEPLILRLAETQPSSYPSSRGAREFARLVEQKSAGKIKVKIYDSGKLGEEESVIEQVQFGGIDLARVNLSSLTQYSSKVRLLTIPYIFKNSEQMWQVLNGPIGNDIKESLLKEKFICLTWYEAGTQGFYNSKRRINSIDDLKGLKMSSQSQAVIDFYSPLGISFVSTKPSDRYSALQAGNIDGIEDNIISYYTSRNYEVAPFFVYDEHARMPEVIIGSRVTLLQLSHNDRAIIESAAKESAIMQKQIWFETEQEVLKTLHALGIDIFYTDYRGNEKFLSIIKPIYNNLPREELAEIVNFNHF